ncbi:7881_t:CDS:2, partial [Racocetra fulgida]
MSRSFSSRTIPSFLNSPSVLKQTKGTTLSQRNKFISSTLQQGIVDSSTRPAADKSRSIRSLVGNDRVYQRSSNVDISKMRPNMTVVRNLPTATARVNEIVTSPVLTNGEQHLPEDERQSRPTFRICVLYVDEDVSVARQLQRGRQIREHNATVRRTGQGEFIEERVTDYDELVNQKTYDSIAHIPIATKIGIHARQDLISRLEHYQDSEPELFMKAIEFVDNNVIPMVQRHAISGQALIRTTSHQLENQHLVDMIMDVLSERGYHVMFDDRVRETPVRINPDTWEIILE